MGTMGPMGSQQTKFKRELPELKKNLNLPKQTENMLKPKNIINMQKELMNKRIQEKKSI